MPIRFLVCVLICEGNSDKWFLPAILRRAIDRVCRECTCVDVRVVIVVVDADHQRPADILAELDLQDPFDVVLYHHDGAPATVAEVKIAEVCDALASMRREPVVVVAPIRETEAWLIADPAAVAVTLGVPVARIASNLPARARDVESVPDPKLLLRTLIAGTAGRRGVRKEDLPKLFDGIAEMIDLDRLLQVPSFKRWWDDMAEALDKMGYKNG